MRNEGQENIQYGTSNSLQKGEASDAWNKGTSSLIAMNNLESPSLPTNLLDQVCERSNLLMALKRVVSNGGKPGMDNMTVDELPSYLKTHWLEIKDTLLKGSYNPQPIRRVFIPKSGGGKRQLGIPCVLDRFIQQAMLQVLQKYWDGNFSDSSFGFRPGRSAHQAISRAQDHIAAGYKIVVDIDLERFFDRVNHDKLMSELAKRVKDKRVLKLLRKYLTAGALEDGMVQPITEGTPQGSLCEASHKDPYGKEVIM